MSDGVNGKLSLSFITLFVVRRDSTAKGCLEDKNFTPVTDLPFFFFSILLNLL